MTREEREVEALRERIARVRAGSHARGRLPGELWAAATAVAERMGPYAAARALGVSYPSLRARMTGVSPASSGTAVGFVELSGLLPAGGSLGVVEVEDGTGARLTIRVDAGRLDVASVVRAFRRLA